VWTIAIIEGGCMCVAATTRHTAHGSLSQLITVTRPQAHTQRCSSRHTDSAEGCSATTARAAKPIYIQCPSCLFRLHHQCWQTRKGVPPCMPNKRELKEQTDVHVIWYGTHVAWWTLAVSSSVSPSASAKNWHHLGVSTVRKSNCHATPTMPASR
jgi:hypothetical protein